MRTFSEQIKGIQTNDEWYTEDSTVRMIVPYLREKGYKRILCPFDKAWSAFVRVLGDEFDVTYSHIEDGVDFFDIDLWGGYDAVVSNPPYSKRDAVYAKLFKSGVPFAMLGNFNGLFDNKTRWEMFRDNEFELMIPLGRLHFFRSDGTYNSPNFQTIWICRGMLDRQIVFDDSNKNSKN